jgi:hypothetical protein
MSSGYRQPCWKSAGIFLLSNHFSDKLQKDVNENYVHVTQNSISEWMKTRYCTWHTKFRFRMSLPPHWFEPERLKTDSRKDACSQPFWCNSLVLWSSNLFGPENLSRMTSMLHGKRNQQHFGWRNANTQD